MATRQERIDGLKSEPHVFLVYEVHLDGTAEGRLITSVFNGTPAGEAYAREWASVLPDTVLTTLSINSVVPDGSHPANDTPGDSEVLDKTPQPRPQSREEYHKRVLAKEDAVKKENLDNAVYKLEETIKHIQHTRKCELDALLIAEAEIVEIACIAARDIALRFPL